VFDLDQFMVQYKDSTKNNPFSKPDASSALDHDEHVYDHSLHAKHALSSPATLQLHGANSVQASPSAAVNPPPRGHHRLVSLFPLKLLMKDLKDVRAEKFVSPFQSEPPGMVELS
jgi:hypothetical protein